MTFRLFARRPALTYDMLNQRQLTLLKFRKHKLAVAAGFLLAGLYLMAIFSPFFAPYGKYERNLDYIYCPPQKLGFNWEKGLSEPSTSNLIALAKVFGVSVEELLKNVGSGEENH